MEQAFNKPYPSMECKCMMKVNDQIITYLKTKNSCGYNEISTKILKISSPFISSPLNCIHNKILFWGVFPDRLKHAVIKPLHKNDDGCDVSNEQYGFRIRLKTDNLRGLRPQANYTDRGAAAGRRS